MLPQNNNPRNDFYDELKKYGVHKNTDYRVSIVLPHILNSNVDRKLDCYCTNVSIPNSQISSTMAYCGGEGIPIPSKKEYQECILGFNIDGSSSGGVVYKTFSAWHDYIFNPSKRQFAYFNDIIGDIEIKLIAHQRIDQCLAYNSVKASGEDFDKQMFKDGVYRQPVSIYTIKLHDAWPSSISSIELNGSGSASVSTFNVNIRYRYSEETTTSNNKQ